MRWLFKKIGFILGLIFVFSIRIEASAVKGDCSANAEDPSELKGLFFFDYVLTHYEGSLLDPTAGMQGETFGGNFFYSDPTKLFLEGPKEALDFKDSEAIIQIWVNGESAYLAISKVRMTVDCRAYVIHSFQRTPAVSRAQVAPLLTVSVGETVFARRMSIPIQAIVVGNAVENSDEARGGQEKSTVDEIDTNSNPPVSVVDSAAKPDAQVAASGVGGCSNVVHLVGRSGSKDFLFLLCLFFVLILFAVRPEAARYN